MKLVNLLGVPLRLTTENGNVIYPSNGLLVFEFFHRQSQVVVDSPSGAFQVPLEQISFGDPTGLPSEIDMDAIYVVTPEAAEAIVVMQRWSMLQRGATPEESARERQWKRFYTIPTRAPNWSEEPGPAGGLPMVSVKALAAVIKTDVIEEHVQYTLEARRGADATRDVSGG